jgi:phenylpropionate dioxygenase-like ring-hydroxylating dioxygenase large terminal subunit
VVLKVPGRAESRFPFAEYPKGWFQVAYSRDVDDSEVIPLHYFGTRLICYRGESGAAQVLDAFCPHLGADIGVGGTVSQDCVVCPFHGWKFDGDGRNVDIPYAKTVNRVARLRSWPTVERAGLIFVWHSSSGTDPEWELPKIPESEDAAFVFHAPETARWKFRSHPQEVFENTVDIAHFVTVHGVSAFGKLDVEAGGPAEFRAVAEVSFETPRGPVSGSVESQLFGLGVDVVRHHGLGRSCTVLTVTPIDGEYVDARYTFFVLTEPETGEMTRMGLGFARDFCKQIEQDIPIWENKVFRDRPQLATGESAITEFRTWAVQSYERESSEESTLASR